MPLTTVNINGVLINEIGGVPSGASQDLNGDGVGNGADEFVELFNSSGGEVNIGGWEIWEDTQLRHTIDPGTTIPAGGYFVSVDSSLGTANPIQNVNGAAADYSDSLYGLGDRDVITLYDPGSNSFVVFAGADASGSDISGAINAVVATHPGAMQAGSTETGVTESTGTSTQRATDGDDGTWVDQTPTPGAANCFGAGTMIATLDGETAIEVLRVGDLVRTDDSRDVRVKWVGRQTINKRFWGPRAQLVCVRAGALGNARDLYVTGDHGLAIDGYIINASVLINGNSIDWVQLSQTADQFTVYHVETDAHDIILADCVASETYLDIPGRQAFDNYQEYLELYGTERVIQENPMPRISSVRLLPTKIRERLGIEVQKDKLRA